MESGIAMDHRRRLTAVAVLSFSLLLFELTLIRVYSAIMFYHFAFMAISVAMLGLAAAGLTVHLYPRFFQRDHATIWAPRWSAAFALMAIVVLWLVFRIPINAYLPPDEIAGKLTAVYLLSTAPFYFAGLVFSALFTQYPERIGSLYAYDLVGAGLGALAMLPLMNLVGGESAGLYIAVLGFVAAFLFSASKRSYVFVALAVLALTMALTNPRVGWLQIVYSKGAPIQKLTVRYNRWNSFSRIMAIPFRPGTDAAYTWCPSPNYPLPVMEHWSLMIDDGAASPVLPFDGKDLSKVEYLKYDLTSMGHRIRGNGETLIIGSGGGRDVLTGLLFGAQHIDAVDINPLIFDAMDRSLASFSGRLYHHPLVTPIVAEGRAYARRNTDKYDLIQVAMIDTWAATTAGAYSLSENSLYTVEAFQDYFRALKLDGVLAFTRFFFYPPRDALRLLSLYLEAANRSGIKEPERCILVGQYESLSTLLFKKQPFAPQEIQQFKADLKDMGFNLVYAPDEMPDKFFRTLVQIPDRREFYAKYPFDMRPCTDDRPFFFNMLKMKDFLRVFEIREGQRFNYYATYTLIMVLLLSIGATVLILVLPMLWRGGGGALKDKLPLLSYFVAIGLSYIIVEVALLQRFVLLLEHPAYAASGVLAGMLVCSGLGSLLWGRADPGRRTLILRSAFAIIAFFLLFQVLFGRAVIENLLSLSLPFKMVIAAVMIIPLGLAMGIPLPAGITAAGVRSDNIIGWCWALNGAASVVASSLAVVMAMAYGFSAALTVGFVCYGAAFLLMTVFIRREPAPAP